MSIACTYSIDYCVAVSDCASHRPSLFKLPFNFHFNDVSSFFSAWLLRQGPWVRGFHCYREICSDQRLRALLVGTWGDSMLLAIEYMMAYKYFTKYPKDSWALKGLVLGVLAIDTLSSIGNYAHVYIVSDAI